MDITSIITAIIAVISTIVVSYFVNVKSKQIEAKKETDIKTLDNKHEKNVELQEDLKRAIAAIGELKEVIKGKNSFIEKIERKFEAVKIAFRLAFLHYETTLEDPESLAMFKELMIIIDEK